VVARRRLALAREAELAGPGAVALPLPRAGERIPSSLINREKKGASGLVPVPTADRPLTKAQETFRTLLTRLETLRESVDAEEAELDATLRFYAAEIVPRVARRVALQKEFVRALAPYLNPAFFPRKPERLELREFMHELLDEIAKTEQGLTDDDLREIYGTVHSVGYDERERKTLESVKQGLAEMFAEAGLQADFSELDSATTEADFLARAEELTARVRKLKQAEDDAAHCGDTVHHSSGDEELRAAEEARKRSIATIYKQLARILHPDLERDSERQKQKVALMQELTVAFRQNDLHTLLRLEVEWIEQEGSDVERLTEEKLGVYNQILSGQVEGLERRLRDLVFHPRYRPILVWKNRLAKPMDGPEKARELDESIAAFARSVSVMKAARTADDVRAAIGEFRPATQYPQE
jgi:hypothetical protein